MCLGFDLIVVFYRYVNTADAIEAWRFKKNARKRNYYIAKLKPARRFNDWTTVDNLEYESFQSVGRAISAYENLTEAYAWM